MSYSRGTEHYNLPQFQENDVAQWTSDVSEAFQTIDAEMWELSRNEGGGDIPESIAAIEDRLNADEAELQTHAVSIRENTQKITATMQVTSQIQDDIGDVSELPYSSNVCQNILNVNNTAVQASQEARQADQKVNYATNVLDGVQGDIGDVAELDLPVTNLVNGVNAVYHKLYTTRFNRLEAATATKVPQYGELHAYLLGEIVEHDANTGTVNNMGAFLLVGNFSMMFNDTLRFYDDVDPQFKLSLSSKYTGSVIGNCNIFHVGAALTPNNSLVNIYAAYNINANVVSISIGLIENKTATVEEYLNQSFVLPLFMSYSE